MKANRLVCSLVTLLAVTGQLTAQQSSTNAAETNKAFVGDIFDRLAAEQAATNKPRLTFTEADFADGSTNAKSKKPTNIFDQFDEVPTPTVITTRSGSVFKGVNVRQVGADGLWIEYVPNGGGLGQITIGIKDLPDNLQQRYYGYSESKPSPEIQGYVKLAESGDATAQWTLGGSYYYGRGVLQDYTQAAKWYRKAAGQGVADAEYDFGVMCYNGDSIPKDLAEALKWFRKAANQGNKAAENQLGAMYADGEGVSKDITESFRWYRRAAEQGDPDGQFILGLNYMDGEGVPKNYIEAYKWFNIAAANPSAQSDKQKVATTYRDQVLAPDMTSDQIAEAQSRSSEFVPHNETPNSSSDISTSPKNPVATGTGFFITDDGYLISNNHVVKDATKVRLVTSGGTVDAKVIQVDAANDLALLKADGRFAPLPILSSKSAHLGCTVATIGFPDIGLQGFAPKLAKGEIAGLSGIQDDSRYFQISVPVQPGNSGGALVDERGNVIGIVSAKLDASTALAMSGSLPENVNYAVKSSLLLSFLESVPEVSAKLKAPNTADEKFEEVVKSAQAAAVLVLVY